MRNLLFIVFILAYDQLSVRMKKSLSFVSVVSPIFNDARTIPQIVPELVSGLRASFKKSECVMIDDASSDASSAWVTSYIKKHHTIRFFTHPVNQGIAKTYRELYRRATGDIVVLFSMDGAWDPKDAIRLAQELEKGRFDIVIGVRKHKQYTLWRKIISVIYNRMTYVLFGVKTADAGSIKAMRRKVVETIPIISHGVFDEAERIIRAKKAGYRIGYLAVSHRAIGVKQKGIRLSHVHEAVIDAARVFFHSLLFV